MRRVIELRVIMQVDFPDGTTEEQAEFSIREHRCQMDHVRRLAAAVEQDCAGQVCNLCRFAGATLFPADFPLDEAFDVTRSTGLRVALNLPREATGPARHILKTWPEPYAEMIAGRKLHEFRKDDRGFEVGDMLVLQEWRPNPTPSGLVLAHLDGEYTGGEIIRWVTYIGRGPAFGIPAGYCIMSVSTSSPQVAR